LEFVTEAYRLKNEKGKESTGKYSRLYPVG